MTNIIKIKYEVKRRGIIAANFASWERLNASGFITIAENCDNAELRTFTPYCLNTLNLEYSIDIEWFL